MRCRRLVPSWNYRTRWNSKLDLNEILKFPDREVGNLGNSVARISRLSQQEKLFDVFLGI